MYFKKNITLISIICISFILFSCKEDAEDIKRSRVPIFTLNVDESYIAGYDDNWVIISDNKGEILSYTRVDSATTYLLQSERTNIPEEFNISFLKIIDYQTLPRYNFITYQNAKRNDEWYLNNKYFPSKNSLGDVNIYIKHFPHPDNINMFLSAPSGDLGTGGSFVGNYFEGDIGFDPPLREDPTNVLITVNDRWKGPEYLNIEDAHPNQSYFFDYKEDFFPADTNYYVKLPPNNQISAIIRGINDADISKNYVFNLGHVLSNYKNHKGVEDFTMGYLFGYKYYYTAWSLNQSDKVISFEKFGEMPISEDFEVLPNDFEVTTSDINNFSYDINGNFDYRISTWIKDKAVINNKDHLLRWDVYAPVNKTQNLILKQFPKEVKEQYSYLEDISQLAYKFSVFKKFLDDKNYSDLINQNFKAPQNKIIQYYGYSVFK